MAKIYYNRIKAGYLTIDDVPKRWKEAVQKLLDADKATSTSTTSATTNTTTTDTTESSATNA